MTIDRALPHDLDDIYGEGAEQAEMADSRYGLMSIFANNIQISQLKEVIPQYEWTDEKFKEEREYFLWWLLNTELGGKYKFTDQLSAWNVYKLNHEIIEIDDEEEFTPSWLEEIESAISNAVRAGNYNDYGGQL